MMNGIAVNIVYRDKEMNKVSETNYEFQNYLEIRRFELMKLLGEIEEMMKAQTGTRVHSEWNSDAEKYFNHIRHKILDEANALSRLPSNLTINGKRIAEIPMSEFMKSII